MILFFFDYDAKLVTFTMRHSFWAALFSGIPDDALLPLQSSLSRRHKPPCDK